MPWIARMSRYHWLATKDLDVESSAIPDTHGEKDDQEGPAPERAVVQNVDSGELCEDSVN